MRRMLALAAALPALVVGLAPASATAAEPRTTLNAVENELMCDTCKVPLSIAESPRADQEREQIRDLIAQGKTKQQILDVFVEQYGPSVLAVPKSGGASVTVWAVPAGVVVAVAIGLLLMLPRWRRRRPSGLPAAAAPELGSDDAQRLERDLARYDL